MRECSRHPSESQPGGGVCARCLEERLLWLWKGESFRGDVDTLPEQLPEVSIASVRQQLQVHGVVTRPSTLAGVLTHHSDGGAAGLGERDVMEEWTEFHARRRREQDSSKSKSFDEADVDTSEENASRPPELVILMNAQKMRSRSLPLDNRSAEDTAQRVINEQADDLFFDELDAYVQLEHRDGDGGGGVEEAPQQRCFSPKWVKVLVSPMTASSRNRVFPSRSKEDARKGRGCRKRGAARFDSSDWNVKAGSEWPRPTMRSSVFSWLQDADTTFQKKCDQREQHLTSSSSSSSTDSWLRDLTTVGHLHEIAEELEVVEESSGEEDEDEDELGDMSSFGKFLLLAAQRQPEAHLTRLASANSPNDGIQSAEGPSENNNFRKPSRRVTGSLMGTNRRKESEL